MKVFSIAMCDDSSRALTAFSVALENVFEKCGARALIDTFSSPAALERSMSEKHYDAVFLDIEMPAADGITLGKNLRTAKDTTRIIYLSGREDRVFDAFVAHPFGFIRKNSFANDSVDAVRSLLASCSVKTVEIGTYTNDVVEVDPSAVVYVENVKDRQLFHFAENARTLPVKSTLGRLEDLLSPYGFIRVHQGYIVNHDYISRLDNTSVTLTNGEIVPVSRRKLGEVRKKFMSLIDKGGE